MPHLSLPVSFPFFLSPTWASFPVCLCPPVCCLAAQISSCLLLCLYLLFPSIPCPCDFISVLLVWLVDYELNPIALSLPSPLAKRKWGITPSSPAILGHTQHHPTSCFIVIATNIIRATVAWRKPNTNVWHSCKSKFTHRFTYTYI